MTLFLMFLLGHIETDTDNFTGEPPYSHHVSANHAENAPNNLLPCYNRSISSSPEEAFFQEALVICLSAILTFPAMQQCSRYGNWYMNYRLYNPHPAHTLHCLTDGPTERTSNIKGSKTGNMMDLEERGMDLLPPLMLSLCVYLRREDEEED